MKNLFKFGFLALALSLSVVACNSEKTGETTDTVGTDTTVTDTTITDTVVTTTTDTTVVDSTAKK